jgi:broad specificity phosphatase PhoE
MYLRSAPYPTAKTEAEQVYYTIHTRHDKFEGGESLDDVACRADEAIDTTVWPHVIEALRPRPLASFATDEGKGRPEDVHIVLVSHGITISELVAAREYLLYDITHSSSNYNNNHLAVISKPVACSPPPSTKIFLLTRTHSESL